MGIRLGNGPKVGLSGFENRRSSDSLPQGPRGAYESHETWRMARTVASRLDQSARHAPIRRRFLPDSTGTRGLVRWLGAYSPAGLRARYARTRNAFTLLDVAWRHFGRDRSTELLPRLHRPSG